jgi:hypothetical protein
MSRLRVADPPLGVDHPALPLLHRGHQGFGIAAFGDERRRREQLGPGLAKLRHEASQRVPVPVEIVAMEANVVRKRFAKLRPAHRVRHGLEQQRDRLESRVSRLPRRAGSGEIGIEAALPQARDDREQLRLAGVPPDREALDALLLEQRLERLEHRAVGFEALPQRRVDPFEIGTATAAEGQGGRAAVVRPIGRGIGLEGPLQLGEDRLEPVGRVESQLIGDDAQLVGERHVGEDQLEPFPRDRPKGRCVRRGASEDERAVAVDGDAHHHRAAHLDRPDLSHLVVLEGADGGGDPEELDPLGRQDLDGEGSRTVSGSFDDHLAAPSWTGSGRRGPTLRLELLELQHAGQAIADLLGKFVPEAAAQLLETKGVGLGATLDPGAADDDRRPAA